MLCRGTRARRELRHLAAHANRNNSAIERRDRWSRLSYRPIGGSWTRNGARRQDVVNRLHVHLTRGAIMNWDVFRAYDIRGIYPGDIDEEAYYRIAKGYVYVFKPQKMVVGMDARLSSPPLKASLIKGFLDSGVDVVDIGSVTTDMLYYAVGASTDYSGGVVVSASHNPKEYHRMKVGREKATRL